MAVKRRGLGCSVIAVLLVLMLVGAYFIVDSGVRAFAEDQVEREISDALPAAVTGEITVSIGGASVITQYLAGSFDRVELTAPELVAAGVPASVHLVATGVPAKTGRPIEHVETTLDFTPAALTTLAQAGGSVPGAELVFGDNAVSFAGTITLLDIPISYLATATPTVVGNSLVFTPTNAEVTTEVGSLDVSEIVATIMGQQPITICVAQFLPDGLDLTDVNMTTERARITLESSTLMLTKQSLTTLGSCSDG